MKQTDQSAPVAQPEQDQKRPYAQPQLIKHGSVEQVTLEIPINTSRSL